MKFSDIMLDLDTGDASIHDVNVKEALGKVNVSSAIFEYASKLAELPEGSSIIQEAATEAEEAGLPTDPAEAPALATEAVQQELNAFYDVLVENAKKVKQASDRDMKAIIGLGKKYGVTASAANSGNFMIAFARPLAKALVRDFAQNRKTKNSIKFAKGIFPTASKSHDMMFAYGNAIASLAAVFGLNIAEVIEDPTVQEELSIDKNILKAFAVGLIGDKRAANEPTKGFEAGTSDVDKLYKNLLKGSSYTKFQATKMSTTTNADEDDIASIITYIYVVWQVSKGIAKAATGAAAKKASMEFVAKLCGAEALRYGQSKEKGQKKISKKFEQINANIKGWADDVSRTADLVVKSFSDATAALGKVATGATTGIVDDGNTEAAEPAAEE